MSMHHVGAWCPLKSERVRCPVTGVTGDCKLPCGCYGTCRAPVRANVSRFSSFCFLLPPGKTCPLIFPFPKFPLTVDSQGPRQLGFATQHSVWAQQAQWDSRILASAVSGCDNEAWELRRLREGMSSVGLCSLTQSFPVTTLTTDWGPSWQRCLARVYAG